MVGFKNLNYRFKLVFNSFKYLKLNYLLNNILNYFYKLSHIRFNFNFYLLFNNKIKTKT